MTKRCSVWLKTARVAVAVGALTAVPGLPQNGETKMKTAASARAVEPGMVNTVLGRIPAEKLGKTLPHEHFVFGYIGFGADETLGPIDKEDIIRKLLPAIKDAQAVGIRTIIDATPADGARQPEALATLSKQTGLNIIMATGLMAEDEGGAGYWKVQARYFGQDMSKAMSEAFIADITKGVGKTGVKAGIIEVGVSPKMTNYEKATHKAAAVAQEETGVPIFKHSNEGKSVLEEAEYLISQESTRRRS